MYVSIPKFHNLKFWPVYTGFAYNERWDLHQQNRTEPQGQMFTNRLSLLSASYVNLMKKCLSTSFFSAMSFKKRENSTSIEPSAPYHHTSTNIGNWSLMMRSSFFHLIIDPTHPNLSDWLPLQLDEIKEVEELSGIMLYDLHYKRS